MKLLKNFFLFWVPRKNTLFSKYNGRIEIRRFLGRITLYAGGIAQSGGEYVYMWKKSLQAIRNKKIDKSLVLGIGGGSVIFALKKLFPLVIIRGVEIDPVMVKVARQYFGLNNLLVQKIYIEDAISWLKNNQTKDFYDLVVVDLYVARHNPTNTRSEAFLNNLKKLLSPKGLILYNCHYNPLNPIEFSTFIKLCRSVYKKVFVIFQNPYNRILLFEK